MDKNIKGYMTLEAAMIFPAAFALVILADGFKIVSRADTGTTTTGVNMRQTPSKNGTLVTKLEEGTKVELGNLVDGKDGDGKKWYEVTYNGDKDEMYIDVYKKCVWRKGW